MFDIGTTPSSAPSSEELRGWVAVLANMSSSGSGEVNDAELIDQLTVLEDLKGAICAAQARISVAFAEAQEQQQAVAGVPAPRRGAGVAAQVALARRESPYRGGRLLGLAKALVREMPGTLKALEQGRLNEWRATVIARETACVSRDDRMAIDAELWADPDATSVLGDRALAARVRGQAYRVDPHAVVDRARRAESERSVTLRPAPDTMTYLTALLPVAQGVAVRAALARAADAGRAAGDPRGRGQLMADTLVERVTGQASADQVPVTINLVMTDASLLGEDDEPAIIPDYGPVPAGLACRLVATASGEGLAALRRLYTRPDGSRLVGMESRSRYFPQALREFLDLRDRTCRTPWCDAPIRHHDHVVSDADGGLTTAENGQGLCEACNYAKESLGWRARPDGDGAVTTTTPTGHRYRSPEPPPPGNRRPGPPVDLVWDIGLQLVA